MFKNFLRKLPTIRKTDMNYTDFQTALHAIRSHMTTIIGFTQVLEDDKRLPSEVREYLTTINKTSWALIADLNRIREQLNEQRRR